MGNFYGNITDIISNDNLSIEFLVNAGPRIVRLFYKESNENLLAEIPNSSFETEYGTYYLRGGHRLWHAPEQSDRTYIPDNDPVLVDRSSTSITLTQTIEAQTGIQKSISIELDADAPIVTINHRLTNLGFWPIELSAWAITQFPLGGVAIFPQTTEKLDRDGLLPNRNLALWPYTSIQDPRMRLADDLILIEGLGILPPLKIGYANRSGWIGYDRHSFLFVKHFTPISDQNHPDFNSNVESYCGDRFIELETLSPLGRINPGNSIHHQEIWEIISHSPIKHDINDIRHLINTTGIRCIS